MPTPAQAIENYIQAKDSNRPHLLRQAFTSDATLEMRVNTGAIAFPPTVEGRTAIGEVLVSRFGQTFENVYTFCLGALPKEETTSHQCKWLVGMSDKATGALRFGCGRYEWQFSAGLAMHLTITIEQMLVCPAAEVEPVMDWLQRLSYPWCPADQLLSAPLIGSITEVLEYLKD